MPSRSLATTAALLAALTLAACNSSSVLEPSAIAPPPPGTPAAGTAPAAEPATGTVAATPRASSAATAAVAARRGCRSRRSSARLVEAAAPLTERLNQRARETASRWRAARTRRPTHVLKGYFSTMTEGKETTVVYVWDVYDPSGNRLHRTTAK